MFLVPILHRHGDFFEIFDSSLQRNRTLWTDKLHTGLQILVDFRANVFGTFREERLGVVNVAYQRDAFLNHFHGLVGLVLGIVVECRHSRLSDVFHSVHRPPTDVQD